MDHWKVPVWNMGLFSPPAWWWSYNKVYKLHWFIKMKIFDFKFTAGLRWIIKVYRDELRMKWRSD